MLHSNRPIFIFCLLVMQINLSMGSACHLVKAYNALLLLAN